MNGKVTMYTIAKEVGMSIAAVSRAFDPNSCLKPEKREFILETAKRLGYVQNRMASRLSSDPIRISVQIYGQVKAYYSILERGINEAYRSLMDYKVELDLHVIDRTFADEDGVISVIDGFSKGNADGVIVSGGFGDKARGRLNKLFDGGTSLGLLGGETIDCRRNFVSMNDTTTTGRLAADFLSLTVKGKDRRVAVFVDRKDSPAQNEILRAFLESAETVSLNVTDVFETENREDTANSQMCELLSREELPDGIYCTSANSVPLCRAIGEKNAEGKFIFLASDVFSELDRYLDSGVVSATIYQDPLFQARKAFETMFLKLSEGIEPPEFIRATPQLVLRSNRGLYL